MALETGTYISDLVATNPTSADPKSQGDDHIRLIKAAVKSTFPNVTGAVTATHAQLNGIAPVIVGGSIDNAIIGATAANTIHGTAITATTGFSGPLTGNVGGNLTGNVTAGSGTSTFNNVTINGSLDMVAGTAATVTGLSEPTGSTDAATKNYVDTKITALVNSAPAVLDTLGELSAALGGDANFATTTTNSIAAKLPLAGGTMSGVLNMGSQKITALANPTAGTDAVNLTYVSTLYGSTASAATSATSAATSATSAATQATTATTQAGIATTKAGEAASSAAAAAASAAVINLTAPGPIGGTTPAAATFTALTTTGNTILGSAASNTLNVGNGGLVKTSAGNTLIGTVFDDGVNKLQVNGKIKSNTTLIDNAPVYGALNTGGLFNLSNDVASAAIVNITTQENGNAPVDVNLAKFTGASYGVGGYPEPSTPSNTHIARINFKTADGSQLLIASSIGGDIDGARSANSIYGRLTFSTNNGSASPSERARITSSGNLLIGTTTDDGVNKLQVTGGASIIGQLITTGPFIGPAGSAAAPTFAFTGSASTGVFSPAANQMALAINGVERVRVDASGNVGIGTTTPGRKLSVSQVGDSLISSYSGATETAIWSSSNSNLGSVGTMSNASLALVSNGVERARITSSGNLLINTTTDDGVNKLQVAGNVFLGPYVSPMGGLSPTKVNLDFSYCNVAPSASNLKLYLLNNSATGEAYGFGLGADADIQYWAGNAAATGMHRWFSGTSSERMRITPSGNILIGTTTDDAVNKLQVAGSAVISTTINTGGYTVATLPAAGTAGRRAYVTDATSPTFLGALTGGGSVKCPVFDNGTTWVAG